MRDVTWKQLLEEALAGNGETLAEVESCEPPLDSADMTRVFDSGYGGSEGCAFALYTAKRVYFPAVYDGAEWVAWVPRNPGGPIRHVGGE
jgi:hypothetical protein